jgi:hypothetical protein
MVYFRQILAMKKFKKGIRQILFRLFTKTLPLATKKIKGTPCPVNFLTAAVI